jgi:hypothetical protein
MTPKQIAALKYMIFIAKNGTHLSKRILAILIDKSENLTREVCLTLVAEREGFSGEEIDIAARGMHTMQSSDGTTHINQLMLAMGTDLRFDVHYGDYDPARAGDPFSSAGQFPGWDPALVHDPDPEEACREDMPMRYTFWFAKGHYSRTAALVTTTREELEKIDLRRPGLYPRFEAA